MEDLVQLAYAVDTFYFLVMGALVMFMAPGFAMLEAGMVRAKNTSEILTKNVALFSIACVMYLLIGYNIMYDPAGTFLIGAENTVAEVLESEGEVYYSARSDFFFQVVFVATAMSIISGAVAERIKLWSFLLFAVVMTGFIYPLQGSLRPSSSFLGAVLECLRRLPDYPDVTLVPEMIQRCGKETEWGREVGTILAIPENGE